ncbi:hypothetical protein [Polyangium aurulentum]|uniref:hypothetical protein n=1 Tax=Polyangium aurulentum TaxID=2567896 RepID=UPI0010ADDC5C|nr:hypothetical protein [Polyangium aurulentum]UQA54789.1 hypothetical protein E8A73_025820 [Polyangium aurulentum]
MTQGPLPQGVTPAKPAPSRPARTLDTLTALAIFAAAGLLVASAAPALLRAAGVGPGASSPQLAPVVHGPANGSHPAWSADDDDEEGALPLPRGGDRGDPFLDGPRPGTAGTPREGAKPGEGMRSAVVRRRTKLLLEGAEGADVIGEVMAGDAVFVVKETEDWALVLRNGDDGVAMGWTKKSQLAIR